MAFRTLPDILNEINLWIYDVLKTSNYKFHNSGFFYNETNSTLLNVKRNLTI